MLRNSFLDRMYFSSTRNFWFNSKNTPSVVNLTEIRTVFFFDLEWLIRHFPQSPRDSVEVTQSFVNRKNGLGWERLSSNIFWYLVFHMLGKFHPKGKDSFPFLKGLISKLCGKTRAETCLSTRKTGVKKLTPIKKKDTQQNKRHGAASLFLSGLGLSNSYLWLRFFSIFQLNGSGGRMSSMG